MKKKSIWNFTQFAILVICVARGNHFSELRVRSVGGRGTG